MNISENIKRLRKQKSITQEVLADFLGVSFQSVSKWERGEAYPDITLLPQISDYFAVSVDELLGLVEKSKKMFKIGMPEPIIFVSSLTETAKWYEKYLGWKRDSDHALAEAENTWCHTIVEFPNEIKNENNSGFGLHLMKEPTRTTGNRGSTFIFVNNLVALRDDIIARGCDNVTEIFDQGWGTDLFFVTDLNGFEIRFAEWKCEE